MSGAVETAEDAYSQHRHTDGRLFSCTLRMSLLAHKGMALEKPVSDLRDRLAALRRLAGDGQVALAAYLHSCLVFSTEPAWCSRLVRH